MNIKKTILSLLLAATAASASAQQLATSPKTGTLNNPLCPFNFIADPTAVPYDGRLYVYGTNDQQEFDITKGATNNSYGKIKQLVCISSADLVNWTFHGTINVGTICPWIWTSWAPSIVSREESDGKTHFYLYFTNSASGIGVMTATSPVGPWKDPIGRALVDGRTNGLGVMSNIIDPGVVVDEDGTGWLTFGGGDPNREGSKLIPGNARIVKLGKNMASLSGSVKKIPAPYHFEANELNKIGDYYVFSYCTNWADHNGEWGNYSGKGTQPAPSTCSMVQMRTKTPLDESSWQYTGEFVKNPGNFGYPWGNNHTHMQEFEGKYYMLYHTQWLENKLGFGGGYRCLAINSVSVSTQLGKMGSVTMNGTGATQLKDKLPKAYEVIEAECLAQGAGIKAKSSGKAGNTVIIPEVGAWTMVRNMDFGEDIPKSVSIKAKGIGKVEVRIGKLTNEPIATVEFKSSISKAVSADINLDAKGVSALAGKPTDVYLVFTEAKTVEFDSWQFNKLTTEETVPVAAIETDEAEPEAIYNLSGQRLSSPRKGINIIGGKKVFVNN